MWFTRKATFWIALLSLCCLCVVVWIVIASLSFDVDIDVNSGRVRSQTCLWSLVLSNVVEDTPFSTDAARFHQVRHPAEWRRTDSTNFFNSHCGVYLYGGASNVLRDFVLVCEMNEIDDASKQKAMARIMEMLRQGHLREIYDFNADLSKQGEEKRRKRGLY